MRGSLWIISVLTISLLLTGCQLTASPSDLMQRPQRNQQLQAVEEAVQKFLPLGVKKTTPVQARDPQAIDQVDLDGDGQAEVVVYYKIDRPSLQVGVLVLQKVEGAWQRAGDLRFDGTEIDRVEFADLAGDSHKEICLGYGYGGTSDKKLTVLALQNGRLTAQGASQSYAEMAIGDLDGDGISDLILMQRNQFEMTAQAQVWRLRAGSLQQIASLPLDGSFNGFEQVLVGQAAPGMNGLFVDVGMGAHSSETMLLVWRNGQLENAMPELSELLKSHSLPSRDANEDGIVEIGVPIQPVGTEELPQYAIPWIDEWRQWDGNKGFQVTGQGYTDVGMGYQWMAPAAWTHHFTLERSDRLDEQTQQVVERTVRFYDLGASGKERFPLLTLLAVDKGITAQKRQQLQSAHAQFVDLGENDRYHFLGVLPEQPTSLSPLEEPLYRGMQVDAQAVQKGFQKRGDEE